MADVTMTMETDRTLSLDRSFFAREEEQTVVDVVIDSSLIFFGYWAFIDFLLPNGIMVSKGEYDYSSGTFSFTIQADDEIVLRDGMIKLQCVLSKLTDAGLRRNRKKSTVLTTRIGEL